MRKRKITNSITQKYASRLTPINSACERRKKLTPRDLALASRWEQNFLLVAVSFAGVGVARPKSETHNVCFSFRNTVICLKIRKEKEIFVKAKTKVEVYEFRWKI